MTRLQVAGYVQKNIGYQLFSLDSRWTTKEEAKPRAKFLRTAGRLARVIVAGKTYMGKPVYAIYVRVRE